MPKLGRKDERVKSWRTPQGPTRLRLVGQRNWKSGMDSYMTGIAAELQGRQSQKVVLNQEGKKPWVQVTSYHFSRIVVVSIITTGKKSGLDEWKCMQVNRRMVVPASGLDVMHNKLFPMWFSHEDSSTILYLSKITALHQSLRAFFLAQIHLNFVNPDVNTSPPSLKGDENVSLGWAALRLLIKHSFLINPLNGGLVSICIGSIWAISRSLTLFLI